MNPYAATPQVRSDCGCLCKPPVANDFAPGTYALMDTKLSGEGDTRSRMVSARGVPAALRMGILAGFLGAMGDDSLDFVPVDTGNLVEPTFDVLPQVTGDTFFGGSPFVGIDPSLLQFESSPTGSLQVQQPGALAQIAPTGQISPGTSIATSAINAASQVLKAKQQPVTSTMTPAQISAMQKSQQAQIAAGGKQLIAGVDNTDLLMLGVAAALFAALVSRK